jgi:Sulfotransferase family
LQVLKSSIHLNWVLRGLYGRPDGAIQLADREARVLAGMTDRLTRFRDAHTELAERFVDVNYGELTADPLAVINRIYARLDLTLTSEAAGRIYGNWPCAGRVIAAAVPFPVSPILDWTSPP